MFDKAVDFYLLALKFIMMMMMINLDDDDDDDGDDYDPETINHVQQKAYKQKTDEELLPVAWHPTRVIN